MRTNLLLLVLVSALVALVPLRRAAACIHTSSEASASVAQSRLEAAVFYSQGREVLVLSSEITVDAKAPASLAWVTATPSTPDAYGTVDQKFLKDLADWALPSWQGNDSLDAGATDTPPSKGGIDIHDPVKAGPYTITPISVAGADGVAALDKWLKDNGYVALPGEISTFYADAGWTFLAVKVVPDATQTTLNAGVLPSLRIDFKSTDAVVPFKMEAGSPKFDSRVVVLADTDPTNPADLATWGFAQPVKRPLGEVPETLRSQFATVAPGMDFTKTAAWSVLGLRAELPLNQTGTEILKWKNDFHLVMASTVAPKADAGGTDATSGATDAGATTTAPSGGASDDGCSAQPAPGPGLAGLLWGLAMAALLLRRRRA